jgi:hypothetical protein
MQRTLAVCFITCRWFKEKTQKCKKEKEKGRRNNTGSNVFEGPSKLQFRGARLYKIVRKKHKQTWYLLAREIGSKCHKRGKCRRNNYAIK